MFIYVNHSLYTLSLWLAVFHKERQRFNVIIYNVTEYTNTIAFLYKHIVNRYKWDEISFVAHSLPIA